MNSIEELKNKLNEIKLTNKLLSKINSKIELDKLLELFDKELCKLGVFEGYYIALADSTNTNLVLEKVKFSENFGKIEDVLKGKLIPLEPNDINFICYKELREIHIDDLKSCYLGEFALKRFKLWKITNCVLLPFVKGKKAIGILFLYSKKNKKFETTLIEDIKKIINIFFDQVNNSYKFSVLQKHEKEVKDIAKKNIEILKIAEKISNLTSIDQIYNLILKEILNIFKFDIGSIFISNDKDNLDYVHSGIINNDYNFIYKKLDNYLKNTNGYKIDPSEGATPTSFINNTFFYFKNIEAILNLPITEKDRKYLEIIETPKTLLIMPIKKNETPIGQLTLFTLNDFRQLSDSDLQIIEALCSFIGTAIKNAKLYSLVEKQRMSLENKTKEILKAKTEIEILNEVSKQISMTLDFDTVFHKISSYLEKTFEFEGFMLSLVNKDKEKYTLEQYKLPSSLKKIEKQLKGLEFPLNENGGLVANCILNDSVCYIQDAEPDVFKTDINKEIAKFFGIKSILNIPVKVDDKVIGLFSLSSYKRHINLNEDDMASINRFVNQMAINIQNSKLYEDVQTEKSFSNSLIENSPYAIQVLDKKGYLVYSNPACKKIIGLSKNIIRDKQNNYFSKDFNEALFGNTVSRENVLFESTITGKEHLLNTTFTPVYNSTKEVEHILLMYYDNSEKALAEKRLNEVLDKLLVKDKAISDDLKMAKRIQRSLMSSDIKKIKELQFSVHFQPMMEVGGDIYDVIEIKPKLYRIFIADATGHGIQAALTTMLLKSEYDKIRYFDLCPNELLEIFNNTFFENYYNLNVFFTCFIIDIDLKNEKIVYSSAGHPEQYLIVEKDIHTLKAGGKMIGLAENMKYELISADFKKGNRIILFTDGIFEEFSENKEEFGPERFKLVVYEHRLKPLDEIITSIVKDVDKWIGHATVNDDITIIGIMNKDD